MSKPENLVRLNAFISQSGVASRRKADELISAGKIRINGKTVTELGTKIDPEKDYVTFNHERVSPPKDLTYLALYKPQGYISTLQDERNRLCIKDLIPQDLADKNLKPIGRLDKDTEGLIILTNDNQLINELTHPKFEKEKEYLVETNEPISQQDKETLEKGVEIQEEDETFMTSPCTIQLDPDSNHLYITLKEGRKRQIRKMFQQIELTVIYLQRMRIGKLTLDEPPIENLKPGKSIIINKDAI